MQWLSRISVHRPVFATVIILALVVVGLVSYARLGVDKYPKVDFPIVTITTPYPGASPSAVEVDVSEKIEAAVNTVAGLDTLNSTSTEGVSLVVAQFELEVSPDQAEQDINQHMSDVLRDLPPGLRPEVKKADPDASPVLVLSIRSKGAIRDVTRTVDKLVKQRVERLSGVGEVTILGGQDRQINVDLDPIKMAAAGVSALEVQRGIAVSNVSVPGGTIEQGPTTSTLRIEARAVDADQIGDIVVHQNNGHPVLVRDIAEVLDAQKDADTSASRNGESAIALSVRKQSGTNTVEVVDAIVNALPDIRKGLPAGYQLDVVRDNSVNIRVSEHNVLEHLILGSGLAALIVLLFLGSLRSTIIAAISIPVSVISTFSLMRLAGFTLNMMTLLALALAVGIVIDDSIVVLENIYRFVDEKRMKPFPAAIHATKEIGLAVLATTLSLMALFLPVAFMSGIVGRFLFSFGVTMAFAIAVSLIVAFTLTPMMAARMLIPPPPEGQERKKPLLERMSDAIYNPVLRLYTAVMRFCLRHRWVVGLAIFGSCASVIPVSKHIGGAFLPPNDDAQFEIYVQTPEGTSLEQTTLIAERLARRTRALKEVESTLVTIADSDQRQPNVGRVYVHLITPEIRELKQPEVMEVVRKTVLNDVPVGTRVAAQEVNDFSIGGQNAAVTYVISGPDLEKLERYGHTAMDNIAKIPGVVDLDSSMLDPIVETQIEPDFARAAQLGVDLGDVVSALGILVGGNQASTFEYAGDEYPVWLRAAERFRTDENGLALISVPSRTLGQVPLTDVITIAKAKGTSKISRLARERAVTITCNVSPGVSESAVASQVESVLKNLEMPNGYTWEPFGRSKEMAKMAAAFMFAFLMAFVFMYLVLAAQFESWLYPFIIMMSLPLTVPFALISLLVTGGTLNIFSMLGLLVLFGMVKKNAILQVDHANGMRRQGLPRFEAVLAASRDRLRPILMTTLAFVAGMMPLVLTKGVGAGMSKSMASIVVGGQSLSLLLTLVAIPVIYTWFDDLARFGRWMSRKVFGAPLDRGAEEIGITDIDAVTRHE